MEYECKGYVDCNFFLSEVLNLLEKDIKLLFSEYTTKKHHDQTNIKKYISNMSIYIHFLNKLKGQYTSLNNEYRHTAGTLWPFRKKKTKEEEEKEAKELLKKIHQEHPNLKPIYKSIIVIIDKMNTILKGPDKNYRELVMCIIVVMLGIKTMVKVIRKNKKIEDDWYSIQEKLEKISISGKVAKKEDDDQLMDELQNMFPQLDIHSSNPTQSSVRRLSPIPSQPSAKSSRSSRSSRSSSETSSRRRVKVPSGETDWKSHVIGRISPTKKQGIVV